MKVSRSTSWYVTNSWFWKKSIRKGTKSHWPIVILLLNFHKIVLWLMFLAQRSTKFLNTHFFKTYWWSRIRKCWSQALCVLRVLNNLTLQQKSEEKEFFQSELEIMDQYLPTEICLQHFFPNPPPPGTANWKWEWDAIEINDPTVFFKQLSALWYKGNYSCLLFWIL